MYFFYSLIYIIALFFLLPFHYLKRPKNLRKRWLREKFGFFNLETFTPPYPPLGKGGNGGVVWVHAVSIGEVMAALPLIKSLRETYTSRRIILSTVTDTGQKVARERASGGTTIVYLPLDITLILNKILKGIRPEILIIIETELWPNLFKAFKDNSIPIIVLNGRISEKSFKGYKKISFFMKRVLSCVDFFGMQGKIDSERIRNLGINSSRVENLGNFKFDTKPPSQIPEWTKNIKGQVITAGSTHEGEEELIASIYVEIKKDIPNLNLIIAPRHPERFKPVEDMLRLNRLNFIKRSDLLQSKTKDSIISGTIILLDTIGELSAIYGISDIAIIGKSL